MVCMRLQVQSVLLPVQAAHDTPWYITVNMHALIRKSSPGKYEDAHAVCP